MWHLWEDFRKEVFTMNLTFISITLLICSIVGIILCLIERAILKRDRKKAEIKRRLISVKKKYNQARTFSECLLPIE